MGLSSFNQRFLLGQNYIYVTRTSTLAGVSIASAGQWDGTQNGLTTIGELAGTNNFGVALANGPVEDSLYLGGNFTSVGGVTVNKLAYFNGTSWSAIPSVPISTDVTQLAYDDENNLLYAGSNDAATTASRIAVYDGTSWTNLAGSIPVFNYPKFALDGDKNLYAGFSSDLYRYNLSDGTWDLISNNVGATVSDIKYNETTNRIYLALQTSGVGVKYYNIDTDEIVSLPSHGDGSARAIQFDSNNDLYLTSSFPSNFVNTVTKYNGTSWEGVFNFQSTSGSLNLLIDKNDNIITSSNSGDPAIGVAPYSDGSWERWTSTSSIDFAGLGSSAPEPEINETSYTNILELPYSTPLSVVESNNYFKFAKTNYSSSLITDTRTIGSRQLETSIQNGNVFLVTATSGDEMAELSIGGQQVQCVRKGTKWYVQEKTGTIQDSVDFFFKGRIMKSNRIDGKWYLEF